MNSNTKQTPLQNKSPAKRVITRTFSSIAKQQKMQQSVLTGRRANNNAFGSILSQSPLNYKANNTAKKSDKKIEKRNNNAVDQVSEMRPFPDLPTQIENSLNTEIKSAVGEENVQTDTTPMKRMDESAFKKKQNPINFKQEKFETKNSMVFQLQVPQVMGISQSSDLDRLEEFDKDGAMEQSMPINTMSSDFERTNKVTDRSEDINIQGSQGSMAEEAKVPQKVPSRRTRSARKAEGTSVRPSSVQKVTMPPPDVTQYASRSNQSRQSVDTQPPEPEFGAPVPTQDSALPFPTEMEPDLDMSQIQLEVGDQKQQKHLGDDALQTFTASESMQDFMNQRINLSSSGVKNQWLKELDDSTDKQKPLKQTNPKQYSSKKNQERLKQLEQEIKEQSEKLKVHTQKQKSLDQSLLSFGNKNQAAKQKNSVETAQQDGQEVVPESMPQKQLFQQEISELPLDDVQFDRPSSAYGITRTEKEKLSTGIQPYVKHNKSLDEYSSNFDDKIIQKHMQNLQGIGIETIMESEPNFEQTQQIDVLKMNNDDPIKFSDLEQVLEEPADKMPFKMPRLDTDVLENISNQNGKNQFTLPNTVQSQRAPQSQKANYAMASSKSKGTGLLRKKQNQPYPTPMTQRSLNTSRVVKGGGFNSKSSIASLNSKQSNISQMQTQNKKGFSASTFMTKAPPKKLAANSRSSSNLIQSTSSRLKQSQPKTNVGTGQLPRSQSNLSQKSVRSARSLFSKDSKKVGGGLMMGAQKNKLHQQSQSNLRMQSEPNETISVEQEAKNFRSVAVNPMNTSVQITETDNQSVSSKLSMKDLQVKYQTRMEFYQDFYQNVKSYKKFDPDSHYQDFLIRKEEDERKKKEGLEKTNILFRDSILSKDMESERIDRVSNLHKKSNSIATVPTGLQYTARNQSPTPFGQKQLSQKIDTRRMSNQPKPEAPQYIQKHKRPVSAATNPKAPSRPAWGKRQVKPPQTQQRTLYTKASDLSMGLKNTRKSTNQVEQKAQDKFDAREKILALKRVEQAKQEKYQKEKKVQMEIYHLIKMDLKDAFTNAGISQKDQMWNQDPQEQRQVLVTKSQLHTVLMQMGHLKEFNREPLKMHQQMKLEKQQKSNDSSDRKQFQELEERIQRLEQAQFEECFSMLQDKSMPGVVINIMSLKIFLFTINGLIQDWMQRGHVINPSDLNIIPNEPVKDSKYTDMEKRLLGLNRVYQATTKSKPTSVPASVQGSQLPSPTRKDYESTISNSTTMDFQADKDQDTFMLPNNFLRAAQVQKKLQSQFNHIIHNRKMRKFEDDAKQRVDKLTKEYSRPGSKANVKAEVSKEETKIIAPKIIQEYTESVEKNDKFNLTAHELVETQYIPEPQSLSRQKISNHTTEIDPAYLENSQNSYQGNFMPQSLSRADRSTNPITERVSIDGGQRVEETEQRRFGHRIQEEFVNSELLIQDININYGALQAQDSSIASSKLITPKNLVTDQSTLLGGNLLDGSSIVTKELVPEVKFIANEEQLVKQYKSQERQKQPDETRRRLPSSPEGEFPTPSQSTPSVLKDANRRDSNLEDPILILDIKLVRDKPEKITIYEGDEPEVIVDRFCQDHNLDNVKKSRLLNVIKTQIQEYYDEQQQDDFITLQESIQSSAERVNYTSNTQSIVETSPSKSEVEANSAAVVFTRYVSQSLTQIDENVNETENTQEDDQSSQNDYAANKFQSIV